MRAGYRILQFWQALTARPSPEALEQAQALLTPELMELFSGMQPSEQAHSLRVVAQMRSEGYRQPELLAAALLHDVGKCRYPLHVWERALIVVGKALFPGQVQSWGQGEPRGWRRAFVVAARHAEWGAVMAAAAGASPQLVALIRHHQDAGETIPREVTQNWLRVLQRFDDLE